MKPLAAGSSAFDFEGVGRDFTVQFREEAGNGSQPVVSIAAEGHVVGFAPRSLAILDALSSRNVQVKNVSARADGAKMEYLDSFGTGVSVTYEMAINGLKETITVDERPSEKGDLTVHGALFFDTSDLSVFVDGQQVNATASTHGSVEIRDSEGETVMVIPRGLARDSTKTAAPGDPGQDRLLSAPRWSELEYRIERYGDITYFDVVVPAAFLQDEHTTYPILIDPSLGPSIADYQEYDDEEIGQTSGLSIVSGGTLVIRNSTFTWETDAALEVESGASLVFDNSTMLSDAYGSTFELIVFGEAAFINSQIGGRSLGLAVMPPFSAGFTMTGGGYTGALSDCLMFGGQTTPLSISGATISDCGIAGLHLASPQALANTWSVTDSSFVNSLYGLLLVGGDFSAATFDDLTATGNRVEGFTASAAVATITNCEASRNGRGWAAVNGGHLTVDTCAGDGNAVGAYALGATLDLDYDTIENSSVWDLYCSSSTCNPTGGNWANWVTLSQNSNLTYRHLLRLRIVDATAAPLPDYVVYVADRYGNPAAAQALTNATGMVNLTVADRRIQPDDSITFYTPHTLHLGDNPTYNVTTVIDSDWNLTLYATGDADNDTLPDATEGDLNALWFDAANHVNDAGQVNSVNHIGRNAVARDANGSFLKAGSFPELPAGRYRLGVEAWTNESGAAIDIHVEDQDETELLGDTSFALNASTAWYLTPEFELGADDRPSLLISDPGMRAPGAILIANLLLQRTVNETDDNTTARPGMATNPVDPDTDTDGAPDGVERRNQTYWQEAEAVGYGSFDRVTDENASSGAGAEHAAGESLVVETAFDDLTEGHNYTLWIRARALVDPGSSQATMVLADSSSDHTTTLALASAFEWVEGPTVSADSGRTLVIRIHDEDDPDLEGGVNYLRVDAVLLADTDEANDFGLFSNPLQRDTDFDREWDGPELGAFFTADFVNASEGTLAEFTNLSGSTVVFDTESDWLNVTVPVRYEGDYRFQILPGVYAAEANLDGRLDELERLLRATLTDANNTEVAASVDFANIYFGSSSPPVLQSMQQLEGWYSWVYPNLTAGTYHLELWVNETEASAIQYWLLLLDRVYVQKQTLDPLDRDFEDDDVLDGVEVERGTFPLNGDSDYDHLGDYEELETASDGWITNPLSNDTDNDGLMDPLEVGLWGDDDANTTTDPTVADTDGDGLPDGWIDGWSYGKDVVGEAGAIMQRDTHRQPWEGEDLDLDGAVDNSSFSVDRGDNATSIGGETDPNDRDTDGDAMPDGWELWIRDFNTSGHAWGNDPLILNPRANDSNDDSDVNRSSYVAAPDGLTNLQEYLADTMPFFADTDQDWIADGDEANVSLRTVVDQGFANSTRFHSPDSATWIYFDVNPYDGEAGTVYWWNSTGTNVSESFPGSLFYGGRLLRTIADGGAILYNPNLDRIYAWEAGSEYAYTGDDEYHNGTVHEFLPGTTVGANTNAHTQRGFEHQEFLGDLDPLVRDSDRDGIIDGYDGPVQGAATRWFEDRDADGLVNALDGDSDADGLPDGSESPAGGPEFNPGLGQTNAYDPDTDHDGVADANDTMAADFDNDEEAGYGGFDDAWGSWPNFTGAEGAYYNALLDRNLAWDNPDTDGDGIPDGTEDFDGDGQWDAGETNALDLDSDDDGLFDGPDIYYGAPTVIEAENRSSNSPGVEQQGGFGASNGSSLNWTGYLETAIWSLDIAAAYYKLELGLADDAAPSNASIVGRNVTIEVYLDGTLLSVSAVSINSTVHLSAVFLVTVSPLPIWNGSTHTLTITVIRADADYRFHLDFLRLSPYHPGEWNASSSALQSDSEHDGVQDGAERGLVPALTQANSSSALGTDPTKFTAPPYLALSRAAANDSDGDGLADGQRNLVSSTRLEAEAGALENTTPYSDGGIVGVTTQTTSSGNSSISFTRFLEPGYYELLGLINKEGCLAPSPMTCSGALLYRTEVLLSGQLVGRANVSLPNSAWHDNITGAFFVRERGVFEIRVLERYDASYNYRFTVDYFTLNLYGVGERAIGSNPSDPDTDDDWAFDGTEFLRMTDPLATDTDVDGVMDSQEAPLFGDFDGSAWNETITALVNSTDAHDGDRDSDAWSDGDVNESTVVFRTNATRGMYNETGVWVAVDLNGTGTLTTFVYDAASSINYSNVTAVTFWTRLGGNVSRSTTTPEGYLVFKNGSWVFIDLPGSMDVRFLQSGAGVPGNATTITTIPYYMTALRESLNWSLMLSSDPDDDGLTGADDPCPLVFDCDGDAIGDGEERANRTNATNVDTDGDGLWDGPTVSSHVGEWMNGSNPRSNDTDLDGLLDGPWNAATGQVGEFNFSTDPTQWDTDGDGMADPWEIVNGLNATNSTDGRLDEDGDGLQNTHEYSYGRPSEAWEEVNGTWWSGTNVSFWDTDGDGLPDGWEHRFGLGPWNLSDAATDSDLDGLNTTAEYRLGRPGGWNEATQGAYWNGSDPTAADTDGDGIDDGNESINVTADVDGDGVNNWRDIESDGDGLPDAYETVGWDVTIIVWPTWWNFTGRNQSSLGNRRVYSNPYSASVAADVDGDGLNDRQEFENLTDPNNADSDFDGLNDSADSNKTSVEHERPLILAMTLRQFRVCNNDDCDAEDFGGGVIPLDYVRDVVTSTYWYELSVQVSDNAGVALVEVYSTKLGMRTCDFRGAPQAMVNCTVYISTDISGQASADFSNLWSVYVTDRNGHIDGAAKRTGWGLAVVVFEALPWYSAAPLIGPFFAGVGIGAAEGALLFGFGMATTGLPFLEWLMSGGGDVAGEKTQFGVAIIGFLTMMAQLNMFLIGNLYQEQVYHTAMTESAIFNPYPMTDADRAAVDASGEAASRDPLINHLWNATRDSLCNSACGGPGNTSDWARFTAGHAGAAVAVELALFTITMVLGGRALAEQLAAPKGGGMSAPKGAAEALKAGTEALPKVDAAEVAGRTNDVVYVQARDIWTKLGERGPNVEFGAILESVARLGPERAAVTWNKLFDAELAGERPLWMLRQKQGAPEGVLELDPAHVARFDKASEIAGYTTAADLRAALSATRAHPEFWLDGVAGRAPPGELVAWARSYADLCGGGMSPSAILSRVDAGGSLNLRPLAGDIQMNRITASGNPTYHFKAEYRIAPRSILAEGKNVQATDVYAFPKDGSGPARHAGTWFDLASKKEFPTVAETVLKPFEQWGRDQRYIVREWVQLDSMSLRYSELPLQWIKFRNTEAPAGSGFDIWSLSEDGKTLIVENPGPHSLRDLGGDLAQMRGSPESQGGIPDGVTVIRIEHYSDTVEGWLVNGMSDRAFAKLRDGWGDVFDLSVNQELALNPSTGAIELRIAGRDVITIELEKVFEWPLRWPL